MPILKLQRYSLPTCFIHLGPILQQGVRHENDQIYKEKNLIFLENLCTCNIKEVSAQHT